MPLFTHIYTIACSTYFAVLPQVFNFQRILSPLSTETFQRISIKLYVSLNF